MLFLTVHNVQLNEQSSKKCSHLEPVLAFVWMNFIIKYWPHITVAHPAVSAIPNAWRISFLVMKWTLVFTLRLQPGISIIQWKWKWWWNSRHELKLYLYTDVTPQQNCLYVSIYVWWWWGNTKWFYKVIPKIKN